MSRLQLRAVVGSRRGKISEIGPVAEVLTAPRSNFGARIAGVNLVNGAVGA